MSLPLGPQSRKAGAGAQKHPLSRQAARRAGYRPRGGWAGPAEFSRERSARKLQAPGAALRVAGRSHLELRVATGLLPTEPSGTRAGGRVAPGALV